MTMTKCVSAVQRSVFSTFHYIWVMVMALVKNTISNAAPWTEFITHINCSDIVIHTFYITYQYYSQHNALNNLLIRWCCSIL